MMYKSYEDGLIHGYIQGQENGDSRALVIEC